MGPRHSYWPCGREEQIADRRSFLTRAGLGFGALAAGTLLAEERKLPASPLADQ